MADHQGATGKPAGRGRAAAIAQMPWSPPRLADRPVDPLEGEGVARIHAAVMHILSDIGIDMASAEAVQLLKRAGCRVSGTTVRMDAAFVTEMLARVPRAFTITPRNPDRAIRVGEGHVLFGSVSSPPNGWDMERGKRPGDRAAFRDLLRLAQYFNCIHFIGGYPVEPAELPPVIRHVECTAEMLMLTDKACNVYALNAQQAEEAMEMVRLAAGLTPSEFAAAPRMFSNINSISPLRHDAAVLEAALRFARQGQPVLVTPFPLAGATAPASPAGAVALSLAEAISAIALLQYASPGCPVMLGSFTPTSDVKSGAAIFSAPESLRAMQITGQMARHYGLPLRGSCGTSAPVPDGQAMWESAAMLWSSLRAGSAMIYHAAGWLEGGMLASGEKFLMDCEVLQQVQRYCDASLIDTGPEALALDILREVGPGGHFFGHGRGKDKSEAKAGGDGFLRGFLSETRPYEAWAQDGACWTSDRAHRMLPRVLGDCADPAMDGAARETLEQYLADRRQAAGVSEDA